LPVCIKRVPDSETRVKIGADAKALDEAGVKFVLNPYDEFAVKKRCAARKRPARASRGRSARPAAAQETIRRPRDGWPMPACCCNAQDSRDGLAVARASAAELRTAAGT